MRTIIALDAGGGAKHWVNLRYLSSATQDAPTKDGLGQIHLFIDGTSAPITVTGGDVPRVASLLDLMATGRHREQLEP